MNPQITLSDDKKYDFLYDWKELLGGFLCMETQVNLKLAKTAKIARYKHFMWLNMITCIVSLWLMNYVCSNNVGLTDKLNTSLGFLALFEVTFVYLAGLFGFIILALAIGDAKRPEASKHLTLNTHIQDKTKSTVAFKKGKETVEVDVKDIKHMDYQYISLDNSNMVLLYIIYKEGRKVKEQELFFFEKDIDEFKRFCKIHDIEVRRYWSLHYRYILHGVLNIFEMFNQPYNKKS